MTEFSCPSCGGINYFKTKISIFCICPFCAQMLVRQDLDICPLGKMAFLPEDSSVIQLQTQGFYKKKIFTVVGRIRNHWSAGNWNEWFVLFEDGRQGWLAEACGFYTISFVVDPHLWSQKPQVSDLKVAEKIEFQGKWFEIEDIKQATCVGCEGELPFIGLMGRQCTSVDLIGPHKAFICLDYTSSAVTMYQGEYVEFDELKLTNLRQLEGWI